MAATLTGGGLLLAGCGVLDPAERAADEVTAASDAVEAIDVIATELDVPWDLTFLPDDRFLVTLRDEAEIMLIDAEGSARTAVATPEHEAGLLGVTLSPEFDQDATVFVYYSTAEDNRIQQFALDGDVLIPGEVILEGIPVAHTHNGGRLAFGPDGMLYAGTGDAGEEELAQDGDSLAGKILRIAPDGSVPLDNPFPESPVWSLGHRNVQGLGWDDDGRLFASEFGPERGDELNIIEPGENYGWPEAVGAEGADLGYIDPVVEWMPEDASPSGIAVTSGEVWTAALRGQSLWRIPLDAEPVGEPERLLEESFGRLRMVKPGPEGRLWVLTSNTFNGEPREADDQVLAITMEQ